MYVFCILLEPANIGNEMLSILVAGKCEGFEALVAMWGAGSACCGGFCLYSAFYSVAQIAILSSIFAFRDNKYINVKKRHLPVFATVNWSDFHFRKDEVQVCDFMVNLPGVTSRALENTVILRIHFFSFTISLKFNWDQTTVWFQLRSPPSLPPSPAFFFLLLQVAGKGLVIYNQSLVLLN